MRANKGWVLSKKIAALSAKKVKHFDWGKGKTGLFPALRWTPKRRAWIGGAEIASLINENAECFLFFVCHGNEKQGFFPAPRWTMIFRSAHLNYRQVFVRSNITAHLF